MVSVIEKLIGSGFMEKLWRNVSCGHAQALGDKAKHACFLIKVMGEFGEVTLTII